MIKKITPQSFRRFGRIIEYPARHRASKTKNLFRIVLRDATSLGWRIAYLVVRDRVIHCLEQHPGTFETFEPVRGKSLLYLAPSHNPASIECFLLDRPVVLKKGIWHGIVTMGREAEIKITESACVKSRHWKLKTSLDHKPYAP